MSDIDLRAEIEVLRAEIAAMRAEQAAAKAGETKSEEVTVSNGGGLTDQLRTLAQEISALTEDTEKGVVNHPLTSVLGALVLGILIGRVLPR